MNYQYDVALSFAGEERDYVERVAKYLTEKGVKVFYDKYGEVDLWGKDLYFHLDEVYRKNARYCVMFLSRNYAKKVWTNHERESAQARAFEEKGEYILPARFDDTEIPGIKPTTGYIDLRKKSPEEFAELIVAKLKKESGITIEQKNKTLRIPKISKQSFNPYDGAQKFISFISTELKKRCDNLSHQGVSLSVFNREGKTCIRVVYNGKTKYSLDMWMGGISGDSSISFYGIQGEPSFSSGSTNAWGNIVWNKEHELLVLELHDLSLLGGFISDKRQYTHEEFLDALWDKICNLLESEY
jgi:hypothetical protein